MKITSVECYLGTGAIGGFVTMKINTDSGIYGWGEAGLAYGKSAEAAFGQCQDFGKLILGMDPFNTEEIWEHLHRHTFWGMGGGVVITSAMAAIDIACWDIKGKALGVPVYKLLGGKTNDKLRAYASQLQFGWRKDIEAKDGLTLLYDPKDYYRVVKERRLTRVTTRSRSTRFLLPPSLPPWAMSWPPRAPRSVVATASMT